MKHLKDVFVKRIAVEGAFEAADAGMKFERLNFDDSKKTVQSTRGDSVETKTDCGARSTAEASSAPWSEHVQMSGNTS